MSLMDFSSKFVEKVDLLRMTTISFVTYLFHRCWLLLLNNLHSNFMAQKDSRKEDQEASWFVCNCIFYKESWEFNLILT